MANAVSRNYFTPVQQQNKHNQGDARIDHHFSEKNSLMVRTSVSRQESPNAGTFLFSPQTQLFNTINAVIADTHVFTPTTLNEFRMGFNRANSSNFASNQDAGIAFAKQNGFQSGPIIGFPNVNWTFSGQTLGTNEFTAFTAATTNYSFENAFEWSDNLTLIRGNHTVKTGLIFAASVSTGSRVIPIAEILLRLDLYFESEPFGAGGLALCRFPARIADERHQRQYQSGGLVDAARPLCRTLHTG